MSEITLPWPHPWLSPNARVHWTQKRTATRNAREAACWVAKEAGWHRREWPDALRVSLTFHPPDNRRRDADNMLASSKALLDGIADAIGRDDNGWSISMSRAEPRKGGAVLVRLEAA
jgi:crossover junction endodeoxyribonuclease RusA